MTGIGKCLIWEGGGNGVGTDGDVKGKGNRFGFDSDYYMHCTKS